MSDGTWYRHPETDKPWANYTNCVDTDDLKVCYLLIIVRFD